MDDKALYNQQVERLRQKEAECFLTFLDRYSTLLKLARENNFSERTATESSKHFCGWIPPSNPLKRRLVLFNVDGSMITSCGPLPERSRPAHAGS